MPPGCPREAARAPAAALEGDAARRSTTSRSPSRIVQLPLSWDDPATRLAIERYMQSVRPTRPGARGTSSSSAASTGWRASRRCDDIVFDASYLVLGLGDVYLGAPVATPLDPRHRLVTTKYNPARTWTPENAVGIGGAYLCVYGMEGPGGYQFVGRTVPDVEHLPGDGGIPGRQAVAAALLRPDPLLSRQRGRAPSFARIVSLRKDPRPYRKELVPIQRLQEVARRERGANRGVQGRAAGGVRGRAGEMARGRTRRGRLRPAASGRERGAPRPAGGLLGPHEPDRRERVEADERCGRARGGGRSGGHRRGHEDRESSWLQARQAPCASSSSRPARA